MQTDGTREKGSDMGTEQMHGHGKNCKKVLLLLGPRFEDLEAVCALNVCGWTEYRQHLPRVKVEIAALEQHVCGRFGTHFNADALVGDVAADAYDGLIVPGGFRPEFDAIYNDGVFALVRSFSAARKPIATMCVGSIVVARAGALREKRATTYEFSRHDNYAMLEAEGCTAVHEPVCDCHGIISCSGPAFSEQAMELFMEHLIGHEATAELTRFRRGISAREQGL